MFLLLPQSRNRFSWIDFTSDNYSTWILKHQKFYINLFIIDLIHIYSIKFPHCSPTLFPKSIKGYIIPLYATLPLVSSDVIFRVQTWPKITMDVEACHVHGPNSRKYLSLKSRCHQISILISIEGELEAIMICKYHVNNKCHFWSDRIY